MKVSLDDHGSEMPLNQIDGDDALHEDVGRGTLDALWSGGPWRDGLPTWLEAGG